MSDIMETKEERLKRLNVERVQRYRQKHGDKRFSIDFNGSDIESFLIPFQERLKQDGVTYKEFLMKSFEQYVKQGGFKEGEK